MEMWVRSVRLELENRGRGTWVTAVRPGFVATPGSIAMSKLPDSVYPAASMLRAALANPGPEVYTPDFAARQIWDALQARPIEPLLLFGTPITAKA